MTAKGQASVATLAARAQKGTNAEAILRQWEDIIRGRQDAYYQQLVKNTRASGEVDKHTAMLMVALDDLVHDMTNAVRSGKRAVRTLDNLQRNEQKED